MAEYSILFADGDSNLTQYFSGILKANGFNTTSTNSGMEALDLFKKESPDLVITDLALSELDGMTLLEELKRFDPASRILIITENPDKDIITRAFRMGALDVLEKPVDPESLIIKIRDLLAKGDRDLEGNLRMMSLASIIQINCEERNKAQLTLNYQGKAGTIFFKDGEMVHAEAGDLYGDEAVYSLLDWDDGTFKLKMGAEPGLVTINKNWSGLLLEGMRRIDESTAAWSPDWEDEGSPAEEEQGPDLQQRIIKAISTNRDVASAVICTPSGTIVAQENSSNADAAVELGMEIVEKAESIGAYLDGGDLERLVLTGADNRLFIQRQNGDLLLLSLTKKSSAETIYESVQTIYKRYRTA